MNLTLKALLMKVGLSPYRNYRLADASSSLGDELSESFCLIPGLPGAHSSPSSSTLLKRENSELKAQIETIQKQLAATERVLKLRKEQDVQLRDSIVMARREVCLSFPQ